MPPALDTKTLTLARVASIGSHDDETPTGPTCHAGCSTPPTLTHALACTREGMQTHTHEAVLRHFVTKTLRECRVSHEVESEAPFKQGTGTRDGPLRMDVVTGPGALFPDKRDYRASSLMYDVTVTNPFTEAMVNRSGLRSSYALEKAIQLKRNRYSGKHYATYKLLPLALSTGGDYCTAVHDLIKELG